MNEADVSMQRLQHGVSVVDTGFQREHFDAAYLIVQDGRAAFVDTGTNHAVPLLLAALEAHGLEAADVDWVIVTHVHLDHAGGAGLLLSQLPNARLVVHPRGARHMVEPSKLMAGVRAVYGDEVVRRDYGDLVPVPQHRVTVANDGEVLHVGKRPLLFLDTPGHANHHLCVWDEQSRGCFTGDTLGICYEELRQGKVHYALPSTTPVQFDPEALTRSLERLQTFDPQVTYITHYGPVYQFAAQADMVLRQAWAMVSLAREHAGLDLRRALADLYFTEARAAGVMLPRPEFDAVVATDVTLNALGLEAWLLNSATP